MIPGQNNLALAMRLIAPQTVIYRRWLSRTLNAAGQYVSTYAPDETVTGGSLQPVPAGKYESLGLDRSKIYVQWWAPVEVVGVGRTRNPDRFVWRGRTYEVTQQTDWYEQDGWVIVTAIEIEAGA